MRNNINTNKNIDDIFLNANNLEKCDISGKDLMIMMDMVMHSTICSLENKGGGQTCNWNIADELVSEGENRNTVTRAINKMLKYNILIKDKDNLYYQFNPHYVWIPGNPNQPTAEDKMALNILKSKYKQ